MTGVSDRPVRAPASHRLVGLAALAGVLLVALMILDLPNLDGVRQDVAIETSADAVRSGVPADQVSNCFQGFCFEDDAGPVQRWWGFTSTYVRLVWPLIALGLVAMAITDVLIVPTRAGPGFGPRWMAFATDDLELSAPISATGAWSRSVAIGALSGPSVALAVVVFAPLLVGVRVGLAILALVVVWLLGERSRHEVSGPQGDTVFPWADLVLSWSRFAMRLIPGFLIAAALGGLGTQLLTEDGVSAVLGDHVLGVVVVVVVGLALRLPLLFEFPLAAAALLLGVGRVPAGVLLFTAALGGPLLWRIGARRVAVVASIALMSIAGGSAAVALSGLIETATVPTIAFDGETCRYSGPMRFAPGVTDFVVRNETVDEGEGHTMAIVIGRLPDNVSLDHFQVTVAADPTGPLPEYFTVAGTQEFVFPGTEAEAQITFHNPGRYGVVCLDGGGFYVIFEFSMPQPMGWFDEFRSTFISHVADEVFTVVG